ncbi:MAG: MATE family efflux transporter [Phycisphaerae bacterium]|nr:MATE family efflux transporter [Phycisphaerae bacterium]
MSRNVNHINVNAATRTRGPTLELLILALPIIAMMVSRMLMGFIDFVMVSRLGTEAQAAISPASLFVFVLACLGLGIANAVQTFVSQADGRGEPKKGGAFAWQSFYIAAFFGLLTIPFAATTEIWYGWIATLGGHSETVTRMEIGYVRIALWSVAPSIVCIGLNGFFNGIQKPWVAFIAVAVSLVTNLAGNWLLIFGNLGFPQLGIIGAAYATVAAWCARALVLAGAMLLPRYDRKYNTRHSTAFDWKKMAGLIRVGGPTSLGWLVDIGSWTIFLVLIMPTFGTAAMAASNVGLQLMHLSFMPAIGIGIALCSQVGFAVGEKKPDLAVLRARVAFRVTVVYMGLIGVLFLLARAPLIRLFNYDPAVVEVGSLVLIWAAVFQVFDAMAITHINALRGAGDTRWPAIMMGVLCWTIFICGGYLLAWKVPAWGINGPWSMCTLYIVLFGSVSMWRWFGGRWRSIRLFDEKHPAPIAVEPPDEAPVGTSTAGVEPELNGQPDGEPSLAGTER